jgi:clan AA aspartic protease
MTLKIGVLTVHFNSVTFEGMGLIYADLTLANPSKEGLLPIDARAQVDTGSLFLCIPAHVATQLQLREFEQREVTIADGSRKLCSYVGPIHLKYANRQCLTGAMVIGEEVLLGAIPIEDMDLIIHPAQLKLLPNPENPNIPGAIVK